MTTLESNVVTKPETDVGTTLIFDHATTLSQRRCASWVASLKKDSFTGVFSWFTIRLGVPCAKKVTVIKLTAFYWQVNTSLSLLYISGVYSWFSEEKECFMAHIVQDGITFRTLFPNRLWIRKVHCLLPA